MLSGEVKTLNVLERFSSNTKCKRTRTFQFLLPASKYVPSSRSFVFQTQVSDLFPLQHSSPPVLVLVFFFLLGSTADALSNQISYLELTKDKQSWQQSIQPVSATAGRSFDQAVCNVCSFTDQLHKQFEKEHH